MSSARPAAGTRQAGTVGPERARGYEKLPKKVTFGDGHRAGAVREIPGPARRSPAGPTGGSRCALPARCWPPLQSAIGTLARQFLIAYSKSIVQEKGDDGPHAGV
jgi:hypothetical protein